MTTETEKFFGRRKGKKLRPKRENLLNELLPKLKISLPAEGETVSPAEWFSFNPKEVWLEVGFGGGEHLAAQALKNPEVAFIGAEVFLNGVASLVAHLAGAHENADLADNASIAPERTDNVRIYNDDVRPLLNVLPDASLDKIFVLFPDPWPKKRHASRRFIGPTNIPKLARLLKEGGELRVASDDMNYIRWSLEHLCASPYFTWTAKSSQDWKNPPADWVNTRYEMKAYAAGRKPVYLIFKRTNQSATCP
ncbi:MAG: tRNA (guanosine(46)-N7)-methyltransferase TrmB [Alphaproteobacteria bacterium]|nr:tRNA (guanosine(46)-N7)-methyltransferase TrmB [Alphaproteobacteria bacterium]